MMTCVMTLSNDRLCSSRDPAQADERKKFLSFFLSEVLLDVLTNVVVTTYTKI